MSKKKYINIFGNNVSIVNQDYVYKEIMSYNFENSGYLCFPDVNLIIQAYKNPLVAKILNESIFTCPDGKPLELYAKVKGVKDISTVSGYLFTKSLLNTNLEHYFYGTKESSLKRMIINIKKDFPNIKIKGYKAPPFLSFDDIAKSKVIMNDINEINKLKPHIVWIGIGSPKQDTLMYNFNKHLDYGIMVGVGAVFNYLSKDVKVSPEWMKKLSIRWVYRLFQEPKRTFGKLINSFPVFIYLILKEILVKYFKPK